MIAAWTRLESQVVNGAFPLQRCVGTTEHSAVFLTQSTPHAPSAVALKIVPYDPHSAELQLSRWRAATDFSHPHLVRIFEVGECELASQRYLYHRMEYAEQTLAQVLERRALTAQEVREMLGPTLDALDYLHRRDFIHGGLRPSNFLVVANQLKLASDEARARDESDAEASAAADVLALGATVCEALTLVRPPAATHAGDPTLPEALPEEFRGVVARCLARDPRDRPTVPELRAWLAGEALPPPPASAPATPPPARLVVRVELPSNGAAIAQEPAADRPRWRVVPLAIAAVVLVAIGWLAFRLWPAPAPATRATPGPSVPAAPPVTAVPAPALAPAAPATSAPPAPAEPEPAPAPPPVEPRVDEVMPSVSQGALDTIRGTVRVTVRVTVGHDGKVVEATADDPGPSRYFERKSLEAARRWTFPAADTANTRSMQIRFAFRRSGVSAEAKPLP